MIDKDAKGEFLEQLANEKIRRLTSIVESARRLFEKIIDEENVCLDEVEGWLVKWFHQGEMH